MHDVSSWKPVFFNNISDINALIEKILEQLPDLQELTDNYFDVSKVLSCYPFYNKYIQFLFFFFSNVVLIGYT